MKARFISECYADTALLDFLLKDFQRCTHQNCIGDVANEMKSYLDDSEAVLVGVVDQDKSSVPKYFRQFEEKSYTDGVRFKKHPAHEQYLIALDPPLERFLLKAASAVNITLSEFGLPDELKEFIKETKNPNIGDSVYFRGLIEKLILLESPSILALQEIIRGFL